MKRPKRRTPLPRQSVNEKRQLREPVPDFAVLTSLAGRATFQGSSKHKYRPGTFGMQPYSGKPVDCTYCDAHASFLPLDTLAVSRWLQRGIEAGLIGANDSQGDPSMIWAVSDNGWIYEGRITIPGRAIYHGYPVLPNEAIAKIVLERYVNWGQDQDNPQVEASIQACRARYR